MWYIETFLEYMRLHGGATVQITYFFMAIIRNFSNNVIDVIYPKIVDVLGFNRLMLRVVNNLY